MVGDRLANGGVIPAFALNSVTSVGSSGGLTFATMANPEERSERYLLLRAAGKLSD